MAIRDLLTARLAAPAARVLDTPIRDIVREVLRDQGYASSAELGSLQARLKDLEHRLAAAATATPDAGRTAALEARVSELEALLTVALAPKPGSGMDTSAAAPRAGCKVPGCAGAVRSKGFCSPHYQQWRRGTLKGFVNADGTTVVEGRVIHLPAATIGGEVTQHEGRLYVDGKPTKKASPS